ncbi:hypothetical protein N431DRAFT_456596 [Stipitochalara longipes BDJ]|nr:hypothetical protein N431DRAFT_456596 [Stipitochalara longipes BDJ]
MGIPDKIMIPLIAAYFIASLVFFGLSTTADPDDTLPTANSDDKSKFDMYGTNWNAMMQLLTCQITLTTIVWETEAKKHSERRKEISLDYESFPYRFIFYFLCFFSSAVSVFLAIKIRMDLIIAKRNESTDATEIFL